MTEQELDSLCKTLIEVAKRAKAEVSYLDQAILICEELVGCDKNFDCETVLIYLKGMQTKNEEIFNSARNFYNICAAVERDVNEEMEQTIGKASRILSSKIKTYNTTKEKLLKDIFFKQYIESKIETNKADSETSKEKSAQPQDLNFENATNIEPIEN